LTAQVLFTTV